MNRNTTDPRSADAKARTSTKKKTSATPVVADGWATVRQAEETMEKQKKAAFGPSYVSPDEATKAERDAYARTMSMLQKMQTPKAPAGGAGTSKTDEALNRYVRTIQGMLTSGSYRKPQDDLMTKLTGMYGEAQTGVNTAMDNLVTALQGQANPFAGFTAQQAQVNPQLTEFLQSQGASTDPLRQFAAAQQQEASNQASAFQNLANTLGQLYGANQQGAIGDVAAQRANMLAALEGQRAGYGTQLESSATAQRNQLLEMLLAGIAKGGVPRPGRLG